MVDSRLLASGLQKVRSHLNGESVSFAPEELREMADFARERLADLEPGMPERASYQQVYAVVREHWDADRLGVLPRADFEHEASPHGFRATLDKLLAGRFDEVTRENLETLRVAYKRVAETPDPGPSHTRLLRMMSEGLKGYRDYLARTGVANGPLAEVVEADAPAPPIEPEAESGPPVTAVPLSGAVCHSEDLFASAPRLVVDTIGGIPADLRVRLAELQGDHTLEGGVPEGGYLRVKGGGVTVKGPLLGHVEADGGIVTDAEVEGGWLVSHGGDIQTGRVLKGSNLFARCGDVACGGVGGAKNILAGGSLHVAGDLRDSRVAARDMVITGTLAASSVQAAGPVSAGAVEAHGSRPTVVSLQRYIVVHRFGYPCEPDTANRFRELNALDCKAGAARACLDGLLLERQHVMRAVLFQLGARLKADFTLTDLRDAQVRDSALMAVLRIGQAFHDATLEALELDEANANRSIGTLVEVCNEALEHVERDLATLPVDLLREARDLAVQAVRHVGNATRRIRDGVKQAQSIIDPLDGLGAKLDEFDAQAREAARETAAYLEEFPRETHLHLGDNIDALGARVDEALAQEQGARGHSREVKELKQRLERLNREAGAASGRLEELEEARDGCRGALTASGMAIFAEHWPGKASIRAERMTEGVRLCVSTVPRSGGDTPIGPLLQTQEETGGPVCFERAGHRVCRADDTAAPSDAAD